MCRALKTRSLILSRHLNFSVLGEDFLMNRIAVLLKGQIELRKVESRADFEKLSEKPTTECGLLHANQQPTGCHMR
jgi:hypothetical protein